MAFLFHYVYCVFRGNAVLLDGRGGTFAEDLRTVGAGDVMFAISVEPDADERVRAVGYTKCQGGSAVVLTDSLVSPLAKNADHVLIVRTESASFFHSMAPLVAVAEALIVLMVARGGQAALEPIAESELQLGESDAYWQRQAPTRGGPSATRKAAPS